MGAIRIYRVFCTRNSIGAVLRVSTCRKDPFVPQSRQVKYYGGY